MARAKTKVAKKKSGVSVKKKAVPKKKPVAKKAAKKTAAARKPAAKKGGALTASELNVTVTETERASWVSSASTLAEQEISFGVPFSVLLGEAIDAAKFVRARWTPVIDEESEEVLVPGLVSAVRKDLAVVPYAAVPVLHEGIAQELLTLHSITQGAQVQFLLSARSNGGALNPRAEADALLSDLRGGAESYLDDGVETDEDAQLRKINEAHANDPSTDDAVAGALIDYAALVESLMPGIDGYADVTAEWVTRARELAAALRLSTPTTLPTDSTDRKHLDLRNRLATLLARRIRLVRAKARFVFREHSAITREATSVFERRRRAASRRAKKKAAATKKNG